MSTDPLFMKVAEQYYWYHNDHLGTPQMMTTSSGALVWKAKYTAFGKATVDASSTVVNPLRFPGQYEDAETGLHYNRFRYYDAIIGRYLEEDPIGIVGGLNLFSYGRFNPLITIDQFGLFVPAEPAPASVIGTCEYYIWRANDYRRRNGCDSEPPSYYMDYGYKYCVRFRDSTRPKLTPDGQKWLDKTLILLQMYLENRIQNDPMIEADNERFMDIAFDTHPDAYWDAGLYDLSFSDKLLIANTPDKHDLLSARGMKQATDIAVRHANEFFRRNF